MGGSDRRQTQHRGNREIQERQCLQLQTHMVLWYCNTCCARVCDVMAPNFPANTDFKVCSGIDSLAGSSEEATASLYQLLHEQQRITAIQSARGQRASTALTSHSAGSFTICNARRYCTRAWEDFHVLYALRNPDRRRRNRIPPSP